MCFLAKLASGDSNRFFFKLSLPFLHALFPYSLNFDGLWGGGRSMGAPRARIGCSSVPARADRGRLLLGPELGMRFVFRFLLPPPPPNHIILSLRLSFSSKESTTSTVYFRTS
jgi:hypothetical protein